MAPAIVRATPRRNARVPGAAQLHRPRALATLPRMKLLLATLSLLTVGFGFGLAPQDPQDMPKPGPEHTILFDHVGSWDAVAIMVDETGKEMRSPAKMSTQKRGEFHVVDDYEGDFMGAKFTGHGITSYCPVRKKYLGMWVDSMAPSPMMLVGDYDKAAKKLTMKGECVGMSGKLEPCTAVTLFQDADHYAFELHGNGPDGKEMRMLRIEYTRKK